jgi:hypothetical protein
MLQCKENERARRSFLAAFSTATDEARRRGRRYGGLFWLLRMDAEDIKRVLKLVHDLHPPFPFRLKPAVQALQDLARRNGGFMPGGMIVGQFLALVVDLFAFVIDVEKISRHA